MTAIRAAFAGFVVASLVVSHALAAPAEHPPTVFAPAWDALVGRWAGEGPDGVATIGYELDGRILVRRHVADLPAGGGRPSSHHEDLMTIYPAPDGRNAEAMYFDSESHVVRYAATWSSDERTVVFLSFPEEGTPRLRLTWHFDEPGVLSQVIEAAPAGGVQFRRFEAGTLKRVP